MLFIIDNYDSFVYNILHCLEYPERHIVVRRNDRFRLDEPERLGARAIVISPGPMSPHESGLSNEVIRRYGATTPILGICLGHQCIGQVFGCRVVRHGSPTHGRKSPVRLLRSRLYEGLESQIEAGRYHSLCLSREGFDPRELRVNAELEDGTIMGIEHREYPVYGVQFHPESILTGAPGKRILRNFVSGIAGLRAAPSST